MEFGLVMPNFASWFTPDHIRETMTLAEELGYDSAWVNDHVIFPDNMADHYGNEFKDPLSVLPYMAALTTRLKLGTTVLVIPYRPPVQTAKQLATIDFLSNGRLLLGIGSGHEPMESDALGLPYKERGAMTDEYMRVMIELWTHEVANFDGKYSKFANSRPLIHPVQKPFPQVFVGGNSDATFRRIVEYGGGWHPSANSAERLEPSAAKLREYCASKGAQYPEISVRWSPLMVAEGEDTSGTMSARGEMTWNRYTPSSARREVEAFAALGVTRLVVNLPAARGGYLDQLRTFAQGVMK
ncbi:MAG: LLM class flavin-dependent oxidoreductase [Dehalococcoidia bacterium]